MSTESKRCPKCELELPVSQFNRRSNGRCTAYCKSCLSIYCREHYLKNAAAHKARSHQSTQRYKARNRLYALDHLREHPCVDCGESDPMVLEFDHHDPRCKEATVADLIRHGYSLARVNREINRCEVRCVHCHRRRTAKQFGWR